MLLTSYGETNATGEFYVGDPSCKAFYSQVGQSFKGGGKKITSVKFYIKKYGSPTGNLYAKIYAHSGAFGVSGIPVSTVLATSDAVDVSLVSSSFGLVEFILSEENKLLLTSETPYVVTFEYPTASGCSNYIGFAYDGDSPTYEGNFCYYTGSDWHSYGADASFYVYHEGTPTVGTKYPLPAFKVA